MNPMTRMVFRATPGTSFFPSNGEEGAAFGETFCENCILEDPESDLWCRIRSDALLGSKPSAWVYDQDGVPCCTEWKSMKSHIKEVK